MLEVLIRAARHPIAYSGICRITDLTLVEKINELGNIHSFIFTAPKLPLWKAGQHAIFTLPDRPVQDKTWRPFSVASAPHENVIRIGTIISDKPSSFKQNLADLKPGDRVRMFGPYGELYLHQPGRPTIGVAGGIGITPFRSIIAYLAHRQSSTPFTLIYSARDNNYAYKEQLDSWCSQNPNLKIIYTAAPEEVNAGLAKQTSLHHNDAQYLLSGPPGMIEALKQKLTELGIKPGNVLNDPFKGY